MFSCIPNVNFRMTDLCQKMLSYIWGYRNIRIFNGCEVQIENSILRVTFQHHKACRVLQNSYLEWQNFQFAPNNHYWFFFLHALSSTIVFKLEYVLFYQVYTKISTFSIKKCLVWLLSTTSWCHAWGHLIPPGIRRKYPEGVKIAENLVGCARRFSCMMSGLLIWCQYLMLFFAKRFDFNFVDRSRIKPNIYWWKMYM